MTRPRQIQPALPGGKPLTARERNLYLAGWNDPTRVEPHGIQVKTGAMEIIPVEARASQRGNPGYFTGTVWLDEISGPNTSTRLRAFRVTFEPGARTAWHVHPHGQVLHILNGVGRVQRAGGPVQTVRPGDTVKIEPDERHWHGAAPGHAMIHLAMQEADDSGSHSTWQEQVTDEDYCKGADDKA